MNQKDLFPYQASFDAWCTHVNKLNQLSIDMINSVLFNFWNYHVANAVGDIDIKNIKVSDVNDYLTQLDVHEHLKTRTINKYISYIRKYFTFLTQAHLIDSYPLVGLKGISYQRRTTVVINWMNDLPNMLNLGLHPETIKLLLLISLGYTPKELLKVRWLEIAEHIHNSGLKAYIVKNLNFTKTPNPFIFQKQNGDGPIATNESFMRAVRLDRDILPLDLSISKLRQSYILSYVSNSNLTDQYLMTRLKLSSKRLAYYKMCVSYYNLISYKQKAR
ncbi:site-specific integrase [Lactobacillus crispatus]|uniref:site-specific integrase n=1 Tax=Lactobacillus crispatus TaxID=47770 RepID=UPI00106082BF|nr:integrase-recombinase [Lactobacillus crispatus]TDN08122.1 integrase-recombinase [Lactobacillus crispatus]